MDLLPWYRVCTKAIFTSKGSYWYGEPRNVIPLLVQKALLPVRAVKLPRLKGVGIESATETCVYWGGPIAMVPCLHQGNIYIQRKLRVWKAQKCMSLLGAKSPLTCVGRQTTPSQMSRYRVGNGNLRKLGWTYCHDTVFAPREYLHEKEATGMDSPEMYFPSRCKKPSYLCGP